MRIVEYRIFIPFAFNQCYRASAYSVTRRTRDETGNGDGFEVLQQRDYEEDGNPGHYVERVLHFKHYVPSFIKWAIPEKYAHVHEDNNNAFPHTVTTFDIPGMGKDMILHTETRHVVYTPGMEIPNNLIGLNEEELAEREVFYLDLLNGPKSDKKEFDLHGFSNEEAGIHELVGPTKRVDDQQVPEWVEHYNGNVTMIVKVVKFLFRWKGMQTVVENIVARSVFYNVYLDSHRAMVKWSTIWDKMTIEDIRAMEKDVQNELAQHEFDRD